MVLMSNLAMRRKFELSHCAAVEILNSFIISCLLDVNGNLEVLLKCWF